MTFDDFIFLYGCTVQRAVESSGARDPVSVWKDALEVLYHKTEEGARLPTDGDVESAIKSVGGRR